MKSFTKLSVRKAIILILILILFSSKSVKCQLDNSELFDIIKLYNEEQYDVVIAKLKSKGFSLEESTPDYTLEGVEYKGAFFMVWPLQTVGSLGVNIDWCRFRFNTESYTEYKQVNIKFTLCYLSGGISTYTNIVNSIKKDIRFWYVGCDKTCTTFLDSTHVYGKSVEVPGEIYLPPLPKTRFFIKYFENNHKIAPNIYPNEVVTLEGEASYNIVKFPIVNIAEYLANPTKYQNNISVPIKKSGGIHTIVVNIGGVNYTYIIDSGASEMLISKSMEIKLLDLGILRNSDFLPSKTFTLADGTEKIYRRAKLSSVRIADLRVEDIIVAITDDNSPLLLGKSFLDKFKSWKLNNTNNTLDLTR